MSFAKLKLKKDLIDAIEKMGFTEPTEIQKRTIPLLHEGRDVVGHSQTGSGKTAAFGLPIIEKIIPGNKTQALILTPTRELAVQVKEELEKLAMYSNIEVVEIHGGVGFGYQTHMLKTAEIVVATPGRLIDHIDRNNVWFEKVKFVVLDEADRMLDMGFERSVSRILSEVPKNRQTIFFSATMPPAAQRMIRKYMKNPAYVETEKHVHSDLLKQTVYKIDREFKFSLLVDLLSHAKGTAIVFCRTKRETDKVAKNLRKQNFGARPVHGDLSQSRRQQAVEELKIGKIDVLVATDVAARGLHLPGVSHVYNYDVPDNADDYTHRIGRTARAGKKGDAITLVSRIDSDKFRDLLRSGMKIEEKEVPNFEKVVLVKDQYNLPRSEKRMQKRGGYEKRFGDKNKVGARPKRKRRDDEEKDGLYGFKKRKTKTGFKANKPKDSDIYKKKKFTRKRKYAGKK